MFLVLVMIFSLLPEMQYSVSAKDTNWNSFNGILNDKTQDYSTKVKKDLFDVQDINGVRTIWLWQDIDVDSNLSKSLTVPAGMKVIIRGNNHTFNASGSAISVFTVESGATLTILEATITGSNNTSENHTSNSGRGGGIYNEGNLTLYYVNITNNSADMGGAIYNDGGTVSISGGTISNNSATYGGGLYTKDGNCSTSATFDNNTATKRGGSIYTENFITIYTIKNSTANLGGGAYVAARGWLESTSGSIDSCKAVGDGACGGGVYVEHGGTATFASAYSSIGAKIINCEADSNGGAIYSEGAVGVDNAEISGNNAKNGNGGGIYLGTDSTLFLGRNSKIADNKTNNTTTNNVYLSSAIRFVKFGTGEDVQAPSSDMSVGVSTEGTPTYSNPIKLTTNGTEDNVANLVSDSTSYTVKFVTDHLVLAAKTTPTPTPPTPTPDPEPTPEPTPEPEKYTVPVKGETTVQIEADVKDGEAAVKEITADDINKIFDKTSTTTEVNKITVDLSDTKEPVDTATLTMKTVANIVDAVSDTDKAIDSLEIKLTKADVVLDAEALKTISEQAKGNTIQIIVTDTDENKFNSAQKESLKNENVAGAIEASIISNNVQIHDFGGGQIEVSFKFEPVKTGCIYTVLYIDDEGNVEPMVTEYDGTNIKFVTTHFSTYIIVYDDYEGPTAEEKAANAIALNSDLKVTQTGKKLSINWGKVDDADGYIVYAAYCGDKFKKIKTISNADITSLSVKKLSGKAINTKKNIKVRIKAYKLVDGKKVSYGKSIITHVAGAASKKFTNPSSLTLTTDKQISLKSGKTKKLKATTVLADTSKKALGNNHGKELRYASDNTEIATVSSSGKITAHKKGSCTIYVYARNGISESIEVTVK